MNIIKRDILTDALTARFNQELIFKWRFRCRPRILMLVDGLDYRENNGFGLWRFLHGLTVAAGVTNKPVLTLAHRGGHPTASVTVGTDTYNVQNNFRFDTANPAVTLANYDQIWIFGIGSGGFALSSAEVGVVSVFMNGGGGVFATGDHASLGRSLCGSLPRIRHMREWRDANSGGVPMGTETDVNRAVMRIDTVVDPGANGLYEFDDQSDGIPQRIYPHYKVTDSDGLAGSAWQASVHPLLMLPGALATRSSSAANVPEGFSKDIDVLPDHPHESVCYEVTAAATLAGTYNISGQNFAEFQPSAANPTQRVGAEIVAYAVAGGRAVLNGVWKPPVKPRMFGVISAYDGRLAQPYPGNSQRPGRIACDSTWHHFVNINLDGTGSGRSGLGSGSGASFTPSAALEKIYAYYRNIALWLQPANRVWCGLFWDLVAVRFTPAIFEELLEVDRLESWRDLVGLGQEAKRIIAQEQGSEALDDQILGLLNADKGLQDTADLLTAGGSVLGRTELLEGSYGALLLEVARMLPVDITEEQARKVLAEGLSDNIRGALQGRMVKALHQGVDAQATRLKIGLDFAQRIGRTLR